MENNLLELAKSLRTSLKSQQEKKQIYNRYLEIKARENLIPLHGTFELTPLCNLDCKMCYVHLKGNQFDAGSLLSIKIWEKIMAQAHQAGMLKAAFTGGECLTYPGFDDLYLYLRDMGIRPSLISNGLLIGKARVAFFEKYPPQLVQVTLYGSSDDAYERVTGHRVFRTVYNNLVMLREAKISTLLIITPNSFMKDDMRALLKTAEELGLPYQINSRLITPRENTGRERHDLTTDDYIDLYRMMLDLKDRETENADTVELPDVSEAGRQDIGFKCGGGRSGFVVRYDGMMAPCPSMAELCTNPLKAGFQNAWKELNHLVNSYPMPCECAECAYHDYCLVCPALHKESGSEGHCDRRICERTKKMVQAGLIRIRNIN